jgi:pilus assembly protein CpaC
MHPKTHASRLRKVGALLLVAGLAGAVAYGQPAKAPPEKDTGVAAVKVDAKTGALIVPVGGLVRFAPTTLPDVPSDILVSREDVVQVRLDPNNPKALLLTGRAPGLAKITLLFKDRPRVEFDVVVQPDYELLRNLIGRTVPTANVEVTPGIGNVVILSGYTTSPQDADIITRLAISQVGGTPNNVINAMQIGGVQQVQIDVVIASVDRNEIRSRGFDFAVNGTTAIFSSLVSGLLTPPAGFGAGLATAGGDANIRFGLAPAGFFGALRALRTEGLAKFLAEPRVVTQTGRPAFFLAGGRQAVLGPASGINGPGVQFEQVGTQLEVLPIVYGNDKIWLEINPQVRTVNQGLGITTVFGTTPGFTEQQARCAVMLESGQTFAIGGLIQNSVQAASARVPVLGDLPFIGTAFSRINYEERESELVILVTPRLVHPMDCNQVPRRLPGRETRSPDDYELFLEGIMEAPRGQRKVFSNGCYNPAYRCDPSFGTFPCIGNVCYGPNGTALPGGAACGAGGCASPGVRVVASPVPLTQTMPAPGAAPPGPLPANLPAVPGAPVSTGSDGGSGAVVIPPVVSPEGAQK